MMNNSPRTWNDDEIREHAEYLVSKFYSEDIQSELDDMLSHGPGKRGEWSGLIAAHRLALEL